MLITFGGSTDIVAPRMPQPLDGQTGPAATDIGSAVKRSERQVKMQTDQRAQETRQQGIAISNAQSYVREDV